MSITNFLKIKSFSSENESFGQRVSYAIESKGVSKAWVAERLGISKQALNYLLKNATKPKFIDELAELLNLNPNWIETGNGVAFWSENRYKFQNNKIPIVTQYDLINITIESDNSSQQYIDFLGNTEKILAFRLDDHSNFPPFIQGSILLFNTEKIPKNEDYVLIKVNNEIYVRQILFDGSNICYKASNSQYKTLINLEAFELLGVLFEARYQPVN